MIMFVFLIDASSCLVNKFKLTASDKTKFSHETSYTGYSSDCQVVHVNINEIPSPFHCNCMYIKKHKLNTRTKYEIPILCDI